MIIRPITDAEAKHVRELLRSASARREYQQFVVEGPHLVQMAIDKRANILYCAVTDDARTDPVFTSAEAAGITLRSIPAKLARRISDTEAPQGIFAVLPIPDTRELSGNILLALDAVQDPGNVGTLLRTAAWFGIRSVLLGTGSADAYNPKVVRATQGAIFALDIHERVSLPDQLQRLSEYTRVATILDERAMPIRNMTLPDRAVIVLGNEAHGIRPDVLEHCDVRVYVPRIGEGESLNVAATGAVVMYALCHS